MSKASTLRELQAAWSEQFQKQDLGGWWSLTGFSIQTVFALDSLVARIVSGKPVQDFAIEQLCDFLERDGEMLQMTQVKRTLNHAQLYSALREAYNIISICGPELAARITFQILCVENPGKLALSSALPASVFGTGQPYDTALFSAVLKRFDAQNPILLQSNPTSAVLARLRQAGCKNALGVFEACMGKLFAAFNGRTRDDLKVAVDGVIDVVSKALERPEPPWRVLVADNFRIDRTQAPDRALSAKQPKLRDLRANRYDDRIPLIDQIVEEARGWLSAAEAGFDEDADQLPVLWLTGDASAGKSVMLLQLMARLVGDGVVSSVAEFASGAEASDWLKQRGGPAIDLDLGFIDDLADRMSGGELDELARTVFYRTPRRAALVTCGTDQKQRSFATHKHVRLKSVEVPPYETEIREAAGRTEQQLPPSSNETRDLVRQTRTLNASNDAAWKSFAATLKERLVSAGIFNQVRIILALNALARGGAESLLSEQSRAEYEKIEREISNAIEFRLEADAEGLFIGHPKPALVVYRAWVQSLGALQETWAHDIVEGVLRELSQGGAIRARQALGGLLDITLLKRQLSQMLGRGSSPSEITRVRAAVYHRLSVADGDFHSLAPIVRQLLILNAQDLNGLGHPSTLRARAADLLSDDRLTAATKADIALGLLLTFKDTDDRPRNDAAGYLLLAEPSAPIVVFFVNEIRKGKGGRHAALVRRWLDAHQHQIAVGPALADAVAVYGDDESLRIAREYVRRFRDDHASGPVLWALVQKLDVAYDIALIERWLVTASDPFVALQVFDRLLRSKVGRQYSDRALAWSIANKDEPGLQGLLGLLLRFKGYDPEFGALVEGWMRTHAGTPQGDKLLYDLIGNEATRNRWFLEALDVAGLDGTVRQTRMLAKLVDGAPTLQIFRLALRRMAGPVDTSATYMLARVAEALQSDFADLVPRLRDQCPPSELRSLDYALKFKFRPRSAAR